MRSKHTGPELTVRKLAHKLGYRFRLHRRDLPGSPDLVFPKYRVVIQVNGCFWHGHGECLRAAPPSSNIEFWRKKIDANRARDARTSDELTIMGWTVLTVWECEIRDEIALVAKLRGAMPS